MAVWETQPALAVQSELMVVQLELLEEHRFGIGVVYLRYRTQS